MVMLRCSPCWSSCTTELLAFLSRASCNYKYVLLFKGRTSQYSSECRWRTRWRKRDRNMEFNLVFTVSASSSFVFTVSASSSFVFTVSASSSFVFTASASCSFVSTVSASSSFVFTLSASSPFVCWTSVAVVYAFFEDNKFWLISRNSTLTLKLYVVYVIALNN